MAFFRKRILDKVRRKVLENFRDRASQTLKQLEKKAKTDVEKSLYASMRKNVVTTPIYFYPKKTLKEKIFFKHGRVFASVVKGEHVSAIKIFQKGSQRFVVKSDYINMPAEHMFNGSKLAVEGIFTLAHEYAHFPKKNLGQFASSKNISYEQAEELFADILSAKLAVEMGYPKENILKHFKGREIVYGKIPFKKLIWNAVNK